MSLDLKQRFKDLGPFGKRGLIYTIVGVIGLISLYMRTGMQQTFGLVIWVAVIGIGLYYLLVLAGPRE